MRPGSFVVSAAIVIAVSSTSAVARADETAIVWPHAASHAGRIEGDYVTWQSWFLNNVRDDLVASQLRIDLARPVQGELERARSPGIAAVVDAQGAIVAFAIDARRLPDWADVVSVTVRAPLRRDGETVVLAPPLAAGESVQRVELSGEGDLRFEPAPSEGLGREVGSWSTPGISEGDRRAVSAQIGRGKPALGESPLFVKATARALDDGIRGRALTAAERARPGRVLAVVVFALLTAACAAGYRLLGQDAQTEQAEAVLRRMEREEVEEFEKRGR